MRLEPVSQQQIARWGGFAPFVFETVFGCELTIPSLELLEDYNDLEPCDVVEGVMADQINLNRLGNAVPFLLDRLCRVDLERRLILLTKTTRPPI